MSVSFVFKDINCDNPSTWNLRIYLFLLLESPGTEWRVNWLCWSSTKFKVWGVKPRWPSSFLTATGVINYFLFWFKNFPIHSNILKHNNCMDWANPKHITVSEEKKNRNKVFYISDYNIADPISHSRVSPHLLVDKADKSNRLYTYYQKMLSLSQMLICCHI